MVRGAPERSVKHFRVPVLAVLISLALVALLVYGLLRSDPGEASRDRLDDGVAAGDVVPAPGSDRLLQSLDGRRQGTIGMLRGQIVVVNFWASWCRPCEREAHVLQRTHERLRRARLGTVMGVTVRDTPPDSLAFERKHGTTFPSYRDPGGALAADYGVLQVPETIVIDQRGLVRAIARGEVAQDDLDRWISRLLPRGRSW
jgi:cytochrome c biogenesis protein CcmG/thiol:disulfide interchange protein DsbE